MNNDIYRNILNSVSFSLYGDDVFSKGDSIVKNLNEKKSQTLPQGQLTAVGGGLLDVKILNTDREAKIIPITRVKLLVLNAPTKKRVFDVCFSIIVMITGFPVFLLILLVTKFSSSGPVFYKQERVGKNQRKFFMLKFRSMCCNAECSGPQLSCADDPRITKWGRIIRRTRLDELPQFWNVLMGEMSVVGPRPERTYFIEKIVEKRPDYLTLQQLKPGITSFGQVNYGYAENIEQMCARLDHDLNYVNNISLRADLKIIFKTVGVMIKGRGK